MLPNLIRNKILKCCFGGFCFKKSLISKLRKITTIASVRIANSTRLRIAMTSPMQSKARGLLPWFDILCQAGIWFLEYNDFWFYAKSRTKPHCLRKITFFSNFSLFCSALKSFLEVYTMVYFRTKCAIFIGNLSASELQYLYCKAKGLNCLIGR